MMALSIILMIATSCVLIVEGWKVNRHVVRENNDFVMDCIQGLVNVTRVKWEYISTHIMSTPDIRSDIYDSQSNELLKTGFEVFCEPHEAFISTCNLKLLRARMEDSGKYICYVGQGNENETKSASKFLKPISEIELVIRGPIHKTIVITKGDSVILPCEHNIKNLTRARWSYVSLQGVMNYQLLYMNVKTITQDNYESLCEPHQSYCNLKILQTNKESAGRYICMVGESLEFEKKYGLDQMTYFIEIQLVVGELTCNENMNKDLTLIGENDCYGIEADVLNLKCSFNYFGNINYNLLHLRWIEKFKFNSLEKKLNSSLINHEVINETNKISIQTNLSVAYEMQNSIFQCVLNDTLVKPCMLQEFRTQYVKNATERSPPMHSNDLHTIKCSANKSENVQCSYYWVHEIGGAMVENPYAILPVENMNSPGTYTCIAKCHLGRNECIIRAIEFEVITSSGLSLSGLLLGLVIVVVIFFALQVSIICIVRFSRVKRYLKDKNEKDSLSSTDLSDNSEALLNSVKNPHRRKHVNNETRERKILKDQKLEDLHERSSEPDITICELPDQKQLIDIVRLERTILLPVLCHPSPKSVLVIGKNLERLVRTLSMYPQVESTTIFEIDERNVILYHECFPNFPSSLDNPKVKVFTGDGSTFLKNNKNAFDVIINHSLTSKELSDCLSKQYHEVVKSALKDKGITSLVELSDCLSEQYHEVVKTALKEKGITSLVVSGQDMIIYDIIRSKVKHHCSSLFPAVEYFQIPALSHPTDLTSCLICSLNQETHLKMKELLEDILNNPKFPS